MRSRSAVEASPVDKKRTSANSAVKGARKPKKAPAKATPSKKRSAPAKRAAAEPVAVEPTAVEPVNEPTPLPAAMREPAPARPGRGRALLLSGLLVCAAALAVTTFLLVRGDNRPAPARASVPTAASVGTLGEFSRSHDAPVYWAGVISSRKLEFTTTRVGTFVRYLPLDTPIGDRRPALTIATYPVAGAYSTVVRRARSPEMTSRRTRDKGIAVWSNAQPTSVYLAFPGVPHLVEVYAPKPEEARSLALSGRIRPVR